MLKIDQKRYIKDLFEAKEINSYYATILFIKVGSLISINKAGNDKPADLAVYQQLIKKLIYLIYRTWPNIFFVVGLLS